MANFTGKNICSTFNSILNIGSCDQDQCCLPLNDQIIVTDGIGNDSALCLGRAANGITVNGSICGNNIVKGQDLCSTNSICGNTVNTTCGIVAGDFIQAKGDLFAGATGNACFSVCGSTGLTFAKGKVNIASNESNSTVNLTVCGISTFSNEIRSCGDVVAFYSSDCRLKDDLNVICNTQSIVNSLTGYSFAWNEESNREGNDLGVIAQDVQEVLPSIVKERDNGYLAVDYIKLIPVLIEEVKRLNAEVEELKNIQSF